MRLIDADVFKEIVGTETKIRRQVCEMIDIQPTAYDVDAVVAELEEHKTQYGKLQLAHNDANMVCVYVGKEQAIDCAIEIVKAGGK